MARLALRQGRRSMASQLLLRGGARSRSRCLMLFGSLILVGRVRVRARWRQALPAPGDPRWVAINRMKNTIWEQQVRYSEKNIATLTKAWKKWLDKQDDSCEHIGDWW